MVNSQIISNGWHLDIPNDPYHYQIRGLSSSFLKQFLTKPTDKIAYERAHPKPGTAAQNLGTLVHSMTLEPDTVAHDYAVMPDYSGRSKTEKVNAFEEDNSGKIIVNQTTFDKAQAMTASALSNTAINKILTAPGSVAESSVIWKEGFGDQQMKCRPDLLTGNNLPFVVDVKTCAYATIAGFQKSAANFYYHLSAYMYLNGVNKTPAIAEHFGYEFTHFIFICIENEPPYSTALYQLSPDALELGGQLYRLAVNRALEAIENGYKGIEQEIRTLDLPGWANRVPQV
jgi:hypothetical protein